MKKLTCDEISSKRATIEKIKELKKMTVVVLLNNIRSSYNVGSIFRTSDGAMIEKLYLCGYTPYPPKKEISKTALGSTESVEWEYIKDTAAAIKKIKKEGYKICALELTNESKLYHKIEKKDFPLCLVVGNEITGISEEVINESDIALEIPQYGIKQSLNAAVAYGIAVYEFRKIFDEK